MGRDNTKYQVDGIDGVFGKGRLVLAVVTDYCSKNKCSFNELKKIFPDAAQGGNTGVFGSLAEAEEIAKKRARHYIKEAIEISDTKIAVSNQWGGDNLPLFTETAKNLGYDIYVAGEKSDKPTDNESNKESDESSSEEAEDTTFNTVEGITLIFRSMLSLDGEFTDDEATKLVELVTPYVEYVGEDLETVVTKALKIYNSNTFEQNFELVTSFSAIISERYSHEICVRICKDLATLAWADGELHANESKYWSHILKATGVSADEVNAAIAVENANANEDNQSEESSNEEANATAEQQTDRTKYPLFPVNWGVENVIVVPIRHCMIADGVVNQMEKNLMAHFFENFGKIGEMAELEWDITDDQIMQIHSDGKYGELLVDSAIYLKEHLDDDQLSKLIWYMAEIVCEDDVIQYKEFVTLKFYFDQWYPNALDTYIDKFKAAGMTVKTSPDN